MKRRKLGHIGFFLSLGFAAIPEVALARCEWTPSRFYLEGDSVTSAVTCDRAGGPYNFRTRGATEFTSLAVTRHPSNGKLAPRDGAGLEFRPNSGFRGADSFVIKICGTKRGIAGCSNVTFAVSVK